MEETHYYYLTWSQDEIAESTDDRWDYCGPLSEQEARDEKQELDGWSGAWDVKLLKVPAHYSGDQLAQFLMYGEDPQ